MRHGVIREKLRRERDVLCFEIEAAGLMNLPMPRDTKDL